MRPGKTRGKRSVPRNKVFVVHGHDEGAREAVARFLDKIGLEAVILSEQVNGGRTIIEKFEDHAGKVDFAVVLATPDDVSSLESGLAAFRPRQNVIFELGFFVGRLGRGRVCLLRRGDLEGFSDFQGVVYTDLDPQGAWKVRLARELENAGLLVDMAKAARA
jgi:predicted nucleotide-binding protein